MYRATLSHERRPPIWPAYTALVGVTILSCALILLQSSWQQTRHNVSPPQATPTPISVIRPSHSPLVGDPPVTPLHPSAHPGAILQPQAPSAPQSQPPATPEPQPSATPERTPTQAALPQGCTPSSSVNYRGWGYVSIRFNECATHLVEHVSTNYRVVAGMVGTFFPSWATGAAVAEINRLSPSISQLDSKCRYRGINLLIYDYNGIGALPYSVC